MNSFKLLIVFILLLLGSFAQRFQRHLFDGTQNELDALSSDGDNYEQYGKDVKFIRDGEEAELELENKELMFKFCSDGCMDQKVIVCYDAEDPFLKEGCSSNQCVFQAGVEKEGGASSLRKNLLWLMTTHNEIRFDENNEKCATVVIKSPEATAEGFQPFPSCNPKKYDGKVIKLRVSGVKPGCPFYVLNAKKWVPPPPTTSATQNSTELSQTTKSSEANTTMWIGIGIGIFILLIVVIGFGYCCYRTRIQKKPLFGKQKDVQQKAFIPEASKKANVVKEKTEDEKEVVAKPEPIKESTAAKEKQPKPAKKVAPKEKKAPVVVPKPSKELTQENATKEDAPPAKKAPIEPTLEAPTTEASVVQKSVVQQQKQQRPGGPPRVFVPKKVILPAPKSVNAPKSGSLSGKKDSLSGRHEIGMQRMVDFAPRSLERHDFDMLINAETKAKLEKFYPPGPIRVYDRLEIELLCCPRISTMFKIIERLVDIAMKAMIVRGVIFDEKSNIIEMSPKAEKYLQKNTTPEFVRAFAFGNVFREHIDSQARVHKTFSIPLLWTIVLQRRYTPINRRQACTWIRRQLLIIQKEFTVKERSKLRYPICAIEEACKMNADGFKNVVLLDTLSGAEDDETQNSTRASEKLGEKESDGGKMKGSEERR